MIIHHQTTEEALAELREVWGDGYAEAALAYWSTLQSSPERVTDGVPQVTGHPARPFAEWAADHADDFLALSTAEVAERYADGFRSGDVAGAMAMLDPGVVRVAPLENDGVEVEVRGVAAIVQNASDQNEGVELVGVEVSDPLVGEGEFAIRFALDERIVSTGRRRRTVKISHCLVRGGRILREEAYFFTPPTGRGGRVPDGDDPDAPTPPSS